MPTNFLRPALQPMSSSEAVFYNVVGSPPAPETSATRRPGSDVDIDKPHLACHFHFLLLYGLSTCLYQKALII